MTSDLMPDADVIQTIASELRESARLKLWAAEHLSADIARASEIIVTALREGGKVLFCGNGGSAADAQHLAAELVGRFRRNRAPLAGVALTTDTSVLTALANDFGYERVFARQVEALGKPGDVLVALSTSGDSGNCVLAIEAARRIGMGVVALLGREGGRMGNLADVALVIPSNESARIQEGHITIGHIVCGIIEDTLR